MLLVHLYLSKVLLSISSIVGRYLCGPLNRISINIYWLKQVLKQNDSRLERLT